MIDTLRGRFAAPTALLPKLSPRVAIALAATGVLAFALVGYALVLGPKRAAAGELGRKADAAEASAQRAQARRLAANPAARVRSGDLFRLTKAMPSRTGMPNIVLELAGLADRAGVRFDEIAPQQAITVGSYQVVPITLAFDGDFYELSDFVYRLRRLVTVRRGSLRASGRLYTIDSLKFDTSEDQFPHIKAALTVNAYVYGTPSSGSTASPGQAPTPTASTPAPAPAPPSAPSGATAAGGTP